MIVSTRPVLDSQFTQQRTNVESDSSTSILIFIVVVVAGLGYFLLRRKPVQSGQNPALQPAQLQLHGTQQFNPNRKLSDQEVLELFFFKQYNKNIKDIITAIQYGATSIDHLKVVISNHWNSFLVHRYSIDQNPDLFLRPTHIEFDQLESLAHYFARRISNQDMTYFLKIKQRYDWIMFQISQTIKSRTIPGYSDPKN